MHSVWEFDPTKPITRHSDRRAFVEAIAADSLGLDETDWLECKLAIQWNDREERAVHLARNILGFANRDLETAHRTVGGDGYLLIGVEPGALIGCEKIDPADLENWFAPYLGDAGPRWTSERVRVGSLEVLFIVVSPPKRGDPIYVLEREIGKYLEGTPFARRRGKTEIANAAQMKRLQERLLGGANRVSVSLSAAGNAKAARIELGPSAIEELITAERKRLLTPLDTAEAQFGGGQKSALQMAMDANLLATISPMMKEQRKPDAYRKSCESYFSKMASTLPRQVHHLAAVRGNGLVRLQLGNLSLRNFGATEVEGMVEDGVLLSRGKYDWPTDLPDAPAIWGSDTLISRLGSNKMFAMSPFGSRLPRVRILDQSAIFDPVDLRPQKDVGLPSLHIFVPETFSSDEVEIRWLATSATADGQSSGSLLIPVSPPVLKIADVLRGSAANSTEAATD